MKGHVARRRFGQHFLADPRIVERIVAAIDPAPDDRVVEIGPGLGVLTAPLLDRVPHMDAIEIDRDLCARLRDEHPPERLTVHQCDALRFDFASLPAPLRVVGNLPYNISTALLFHIAAVAARCTDLHFMLQQEVVDRMVAEPATAEYGRLSVMLQYRFRMKRLLTVPPGAFRPAPKVKSAVVKLVPRPVEELGARDAAMFSRVVAQAFSMRRKTLRNSLAELISASDLAHLGVDPGLRAEALPFAAYVTISNLLVSRSV